MLFEQHQTTFKSSNYFQERPQPKRTSRRQNTLQEFRILNPLVNPSHCFNPEPMPNLPSSIKNHLSRHEYLTFSNVNNIGKSQKHSPSTATKRNSGFSKRLVEMQKALQLQTLKLHNLETGNMEEHDFQKPFANYEQSYISLFDEQRNSLQIKCIMGQNLDRFLEFDFEPDMCHEQSKSTQLQYYSERYMQQQINYHEYESYLNV